MIEALTEKPGMLGIVDVKGRRHVVAVSAIGQPQATGPRATYLKIRGYENLFVNCPIDQVREAILRARALRKAAAPAQLELDFHG